MAKAIFPSQPSVPLWPNYGLYYTTASTNTAIGWAGNTNYVSYPAVAPFAPAPEDDLSWLYRRVREITDLAPKAA